MFNVLFSLAKDGSSQSPCASPGNSSRDHLINTVYKQHRLRQRILEPYRRIKNALKKMQDEYAQSKEDNLFARYMRMQHMIHEVTILEKQYWQLLDVPGPGASEPATDYVRRVMEILDDVKAMPQRTGIAGLLNSTFNVDRTRDATLFESIKKMSTSELRKECDQMYLDLYKLIKKYLGLRKIVKDLYSEYRASRFLPMVPRYALLKTMIKNVLRAPEFAEVCHESTE
ncbi:hypothetical protein Tcan_07015 [Toxocara canis]|uniref:Uncharacterized protein n=1 Tax=Toxocara canis TaxID=6265 RepID=A0A0B2VZK9_TOXCA|nr:hypothetical protein Tcan_07015 [Toxocara canis]